MKSVRRIVLISCMILAIFVTSVPVMAFPTQDTEVMKHFILDLSDPTIRIPIPKSYEVIDVIINFGEEFGSLSNANHLFMDSNDFLHIADTGNHRVLRLDHDFNVTLEITYANGLSLRSPQGLYVDRHGDIFIADSGNFRILHMDSFGNFIEEFSRPDTTLVGEEFTFNPENLVITNTGFIFFTNGFNIAMLDSFNVFRGFSMSERLPFSFTELVFNIFATQAQRDRRLRRTPAPYSNIFKAQDGMIYATAIHTDSRQIQRINSVGNNIFPDEAFGEITRDRDGSFLRPHFVDLTVNAFGIVTVIDRDKSLVYQYDPEGNLLAAFGGVGSLKGNFETMSSIAEDSEGNLFILDARANNIQVLRPTLFMRLVHEAIYEQTEGRHENAMVLWERVLAINSNYTVAHGGMARSLERQGRWRESMAAFEIAYDRVGYTRVFNELRYEIFRDNFFLIVVIVIGGFIALVHLLNRAKKFTNNVMNNFLYGEKS